MAPRVENGSTRKIINTIKIYLIWQEKRKKGLPLWLKTKSVLQSVKISFELKVKFSMQRNGKTNYLRTLKASFKENGSDVVTQHNENNIK